MVIHDISYAHCPANCFTGKQVFHLNVKKSFRKKICPEVQGLLLAQQTNRLILILRIVIPILCEQQAFVC